jgi:NIMA (never in mitosis gene a)-related kinase
MLNRYATTEPRRNRLAHLGFLRPLASLLRATDVVLRLALEALVHLTTHSSAVVLGSLAAMSSQDAKGEPTSPLASDSGDVLQQCLGLLNHREEMYVGLGAQLLEQLLEASEFRAQLRRSRGMQVIVACLQVDACEGKSRGRGRASPPLPREGTAQFQTFKKIKLLRCCRKLARDHVDLGDPLAVQQLREHEALSVIISLLRGCQRDMREADVLVAALDTLAQMCMDDECAFSLRSHVDGIAVIGNLLLDAPWRPASVYADAAHEQPHTMAVQCAAARLLRFLWAMERNRKAFKHIFSAEMFGDFIDIGNYIWPLEAFVPFVRKLNGLPEKDVAQIRSNYLRSFERGMMMRMGSEQGCDQLQKGIVGTHMPMAHRPSSLSSRECSSQQHRDSYAVGRMVGGYELLECVGAGAFGQVHLARKAGITMDFALKEVALTPLSDSIGGWPTAAQPKAPTHTPRPQGRRPSSRCSTPNKGRGSPEATLPEAAVNDGATDGVGQEQVAKDISQEVQLLRQLDHPNIVRYYESFVIGAGTSSTLWIAMEYCKGASLQNFIASKREKGFVSLPEEHSWQIFVQLCFALRYLHVDKRIAHRDLTPNNVLVQAQCLTTKIADFGLAKKNGMGTKNASMMKSMVGTILYSCPEIVQHKPYTLKTDVWALGCLLYKMATLTDPFSGTNPLTVARKIVECDYKPLLPSQHSEMLIGTCRKCLTVEPESRPDIRQVLQLITPALVQHAESLQKTLVQPNRGSLSPQFHSAHSSAPSQVPGPTGDIAQHVDESPKHPTRHKFLDEGCGNGGDHLRESKQSAVTDTSERSAQSVQTALSVQTAQSADTVKTERSHIPEGQPIGAVQVPLHMLGTVVDPLQKALQLVHQLVFLAQVPAVEVCNTVEAHRLALAKQQAVVQYQRWLFGSPQGAMVMKREVSRLMQRVPDFIDCSGPQGEAASEYYRGDLGELSQLTYDTLHDYISELCIVHGHDLLAISSRGSSSSDAYKSNSRFVGV